MSQLPDDEQCIASFDTFAFTFPDIYGAKQERILPLPPWKAVAELPNTENSLVAQDRGKMEVIATRSIGENLEIWMSNSGADKHSTNLIYSVNTHEWTLVPSMIAGSSVQVESIHISNDEQSVWGVGINDGKIVYSTFDDISKSFVTQYIQDIPTNWTLSVNSQSNNVFENSKTLWDINDTFWIFSGNDAIYNFDPVNMQLIRLASLEKYEYLGDLVYDLKDNIFFDVYHGDKGIMQYTISTGSLEEIPSSNMAVSNVSLIDSVGNLWLRDGYGWRTPEGDWQRFHPNPINYWWHLDFLDEWVYYVPPDPVSQTSDGRIWFVIYRSEEWKTLRSGIAWFDPVTKKGCWFTSEGAQVAEDLQSNLWTAIDGQLYTYENNP